MVRLVDIKSDYGEDVGDIVDDLTVLTPLNHLELREIFTDEELKELRENLIEVRAATDESEKIAKLMELAPKLLKLLGKAGFAL